MLIGVEHDGVTHQVYGRQVVVHPPALHDALRKRCGHLHLELFHGFAPGRGVVAQHFA